jgi:hypothetical protein
MARVSDDEVLLLWRALRAFRSGRQPPCRPRGRPAGSKCPLCDRCPRWRGQPDDRAASLEETAAETERRRASWPCSTLLDLLSPELTRIGPRQRAGRSDSGPQRSLPRGPSVRTRSSAADPVTALGWPVRRRAREPGERPPPAPVRGQRTRPPATITRLCGSLSICAAHPCLITASGHPRAARPALDTVKCAELPAPAGCRHILVTAACRPRGGGARRGVMFLLRLIASGADGSCFVNALAARGQENAGIGVKTTAPARTIRAPVVAALSRHRQRPERCRVGPGCGHRCPHRHAAARRVARGGRAGARRASGRPAGAATPAQRRLG